MRHRSKTVKLKRNASQRRALLANLACNLIEHGRIKAWRDYFDTGSLTSDDRPA